MDPEIKNFYKDGRFKRKSSSKSIRCMLFLPYRKINRIFLSLHVTVKAKLKAKFV